jgi:hypothetical protein
VPTPIYHFTHARNLPKILHAGGLYCKAELPSDLEVVDISLQDIQEKRRAKRVRCEPGGILHDYVPFLFSTRSPMMFRISKGNVEGRSRDTTNLIYVVSSVERVREAGLAFVFTDGHPIMALSTFYNEVADLDKVDWKVMRMRYWKDTDDDNDRERRRQAEFLVQGTFPWEIVEFLAVKNNDIGRRLQNYLSDEWPDKVKPVKVAPSWYF